MSTPRLGIRSPLHGSLAFLAMAATPVAAQVAVSIDWHGPTISVPDSATATPITEGDLLGPAPGIPTLGPLPPPSIVLTAGFGGLGLPLYPVCVGHPPGTPCLVEVDAVSDGKALYLPQPGANVAGSKVWFSVDEFAKGRPQPVVPSVFSEAPCGDSSADLWTELSLPLGPLTPNVASAPWHVGVVDGDGLPSCTGTSYPGLGLLEPNPPGAPPDAGDNVDALLVRTPLIPPGGGGIYFSLDAAFVDPLTGVAHSGSAAAHGVSGADVLTPSPAGPPVVWAPAPLLGLDLVAGAGSDDLDALAVAENGTGVFEPSVQPFDWATGATDMVLFSVRRGSAVIGMPDSLFGLPIEEGDILTTPIPTAFGGVSPFPAIFIAAENLGLATARLSPTVNQFGDDLDALDLVRTAFFDCDGDTIEDAVAIALGIVADVNSNGIPDSCETSSWTPYCFCPIGPCLNNDPTAGCRNVTGVGALLTASGSSSVIADNLVLTTTNLPTNNFGLYYFGPAQIFAPFGNGIRCVGGGVRRFGVQNTGPAGTLTLGPGIVAHTIANFPPSFWITPFSTWNFQCWYRDPGGPCGFSFNFSNGMSVTFSP